MPHWKEVRQMKPGHDHDIFQSSIDQTLSGLQGDPFLGQRVLSRTEKGEISMKHSWKYSPLLVALLIICMLATALAASIGGKYLNWAGETLPPEEEEELVLPQSTPVPEHPEQTQDAQSASADLDLLAWEMLNTASDHELIVVFGDHGGVSTIQTPFSTLEECQTLLENAPYLPKVLHIPEGYALTGGQIYYELKENAWPQRISQEVTEEGLQVARYSVAEEDLMITSYSLSFETQHEDPLMRFVDVHVNLDIRSGMDDFHFILSEGQVGEAVHVNGMDNALALSSPDYNSIYMRKFLPESMTVSLVFTEEAKLTLMPWEYGQVTLHAVSPLLSTQDLIALFTE